MATLELDLTDPLRTFELSARLSVGAETFALVGPSGAGKSTILRHVAGLRKPAAGRIALDDDVWFDSTRRVNRAPDRRSVGLVFQEYALFPHLSVAQNVAFGGASEARVGELLERLHIGHLAREKPTRLSGGERQRVAVARALGRDPQVLLLDEPLSALDAHTRTAVREQLADILATLRIPTLIVTHDFLDASTLADRVGVIREGRLLQTGRPEELTARPADELVASLTGSNLLHGTADGTRVTLDDGTVIEVAEAASGRVGVAVYPWEITVTSTPPSAGNVVSGTVGALTPDRGRTRVRVGPLVAEVASVDGLERGALAYAAFPPRSARLIR